MRLSHSKQAFRYLEKCELKLYYNIYKMYYERVGALGADGHIVQATRESSILR